MATFRTSQCHDGDEVLKFHEWRCQGIKRRFRKPEHTKEHIKKDSNRCFVEKILNLSQIYNRSSKWIISLFHITTVTTT